MRAEASMPAWLIFVLGLWAAYWAALFAQLAHLRTLDDGVGALACAVISSGFLVLALGLFLTA